MTAQVNLSRFCDAHRRCLVALLVSLFLAACGGGNDAKSTAATVRDAGQRATAMSAGTADTSPPVSVIASLNGAPQVLQMELVAEKRFDRTRFDYVYRVLIGGAASNFETAAFKVTSSATATTVLDGDINIGKLSAGQYIRVADTITVRHDRTVPLNKDAIQFTFAGTTPPPPQGSDPSITIGTVGFFKVGGRPGHQGYLPISSNNPVAGDSVQLRASVHGKPTRVGFTLLDRNDATLSTGALEVIGGSGESYGAPINIPGEPFKIRVTAESGNLVPLTWTSPDFVPLKAQIELIFEDAVFVGSTTMKGVLIVPSSTTAETYSIKLILPDGFSANSTTWKVVAQVNTPTKIPVSITTPGNAAYLTKKLTVIWSSNAQTVEAMSFATVMGL